MERIFLIRTLIDPSRPVTERLRSLQSITTKRKSRALKVGYEAGKSEARYRFTSSHCRAIQTHDILYSAHCPGTKAIVLDVSLFRSMEASASKIEYHQ